MVRKKYLFPLFLILAVFILFIVIKPAKKEVSRSTNFQRIVERNLQPDSILNSDFLKDSYRLYSFGDSIFFMSGKGGFMTDSQFRVIRRLNNFSPESSIYYFEKMDDTLVFFDVDKRQLTIETDSLYVKKTNGLPGNAIYFNREFLYQEAVGDSLKDLIIINSWNASENSIDTLVNLNNFLSGKLVGCKECLSNTLEGNFFKVDNQTWAYLFYKAGYFLINRNGNFRLVPTIDKSPFRKYEVREVQFNNMKAFLCKSDNESMINYAAVSDSKHIFVLSGKIVVGGQKELFAPVDVYDIANFEYKYTLQAPMTSMDNYAYLMTKSGNYVYLYFKEGEIVRYKLQ